MLIPSPRAYPLALESKEKDRPSGLKKPSALSPHWSSGSKMRFAPPTKAQRVGLDSDRIDSQARCKAVMELEHAVSQVTDGPRRLLPDHGECGSRLRVLWCGVQISHEDSLVIFREATYETGSICIGYVRNRDARVFQTLVSNLQEQTLLRVVGSCLGGRAGKERSIPLGYVLIQKISPLANLSRPVSESSADYEF